MTAEDALKLTIKKQIMVIGDDLIDVWIHGHLESCQDGCQKFVRSGQQVTVPGGAGNASRSLRNSSADAHLYVDSFREQCRKIRFVADGRIVFRSDHEPDNRWSEIESVRKFTLETLRGKDLDGVYVADYDKGFLTGEMVSQIVVSCKNCDIPCVVDPKRDPKWCVGAVLKCNGEFALKWGVLDHHPGAVITHAHLPPTVFDEHGVTGDLGYTMLRKDGPAFCVNHVGAGDCFGAWLTFGLTHGLRLQEAARLAHAVGRVYVQHPHNSPPWVHEIRKELDPVGGKVLEGSDLEGLRKSTTGRIVFTNGCFRLPHAGHSWLFDWARGQGDLLVVGVNSDISTFRVKEGKKCLPLSERLQVLASHQAIDYLIVFDDNTPIEAIRLLKPDLIARGSDQPNDGSELCEVRVAPVSPFPSHSGDIEKMLRG